MFQELIDRNNTSFPKQVAEIVKKIHSSEDDVLRKHQKIAVEYLLNYNVRGILCYQKMGSGKTIIGVKSAIEFMRKGYDIIFLSSKSLHNNFKEDIEKYLSLAGQKEQGIDSERVIDSIDFVSMNASNMIKQMRRAINKDMIEDEDIVADLENKFLIIDEAHNFFNSISNESKNATKLYDMILKAKNVKLLFLTGNPITNTPFEVAVCYNMLAGPIGEHTLFGEDYATFSKLYIKGKTVLEDEGQHIMTIPHIHNADKFSDRIFGLTSFFGADSEEQMKLFPQQYPMSISVVPMSKDQYSYYIIAREQEIKQTSNKIMRAAQGRFNKPGAASSSYRVHSRQFSNVVYPEYAMEFTREGSNFKVSKYPDRLNPEDLRVNLKTYSPKLFRMLQNISLHTPPQILSHMELPKKTIDKIVAKRRESVPDWQIGIGKGFIYSQFLEAGVKFIGKTLEAFGFTYIEDEDSLFRYMKQEEKLGSYAIISGEIDVDMRQKIINIYNSSENQRGEVITLLLVTSTGAEGIDLKGGRHGHIFEPYWNYSRINQVVARLVRAGSHLDLPEEDRTVQFYIYLADYPKALLEKDGKMSELTTDKSIYHNSVQNQMLIESFNKTIQESSIDCMAHYGDSDKIDCRICVPNGRTLWYPGKAKMTMDSPCEKLTEKKITAKEIMVNDNPFAYVVKENAVHIFEKDEALGSYREIFLDHPLYDQIRDAIAKVEKIKRSSA